MTDKEHVRRPDTKFIHEFGPGEHIVAMIEFQGTIYVATSKSVFKMIDEELHPLLFVAPTEGMIAGYPPQKED